MDLSEIKTWMAAAKQRCMDGQPGFTVIGFEYTDAGDAKNHKVLGHYDARDEAVEMVGKNPDCAYILNDEDLAFGLIPKLLGELETLRARMHPRPINRERESNL